MKRRGRGQSLAEFAIVLPVFLMLLFGTIDLGRGIWATDAATHAAAEAARFTIVHGGSAATGCPVGPPAATAIIPSASAACPYPSPSKQAIKDMATQAAIASGAGTEVHVCYGEGCGGATSDTWDTDVPGATNARGTLITVRVTVHVHLVTGSLLHIPDFALTGTSTMVVNH